MPAPKLTPDVQSKMCQLIRAGNTVELAAAVVDISPDTYKNWLARGKAEEEGIYKDFREAVEMARVEHEAILVTQIATAAKRSWRAAVWLLERHYPERWAQQTEVKEETPQQSAAQVIRDELAERRANRA